MATRKLGSSAKNFCSWIYRETNFSASHDNQNRNPKKRLHKNVQELSSLFTRLRLNGLSAFCQSEFMIRLLSCYACEVRQKFLRKIFISKISLDLIHRIL